MRDTSETSSGGRVPAKGPASSGQQDRLGEIAMCLGIPGQIIELLEDPPDLAKVDVAGVKRNVNVGLVSPEGIAAGDWVLIHVGFAMSKIDEEQAKKSLNFLEGLGQTYQDELDALAESSID